MRVLFFAVIIGFAGLVAVPGPAEAQRTRAGDATVLRMSLFVGDDHPLLRQVFEPFARQVEIATEGSLQIQFVPNGWLAPIRNQQLDLVNNDTLDGALVLIEDEFQRFPDDRVFQLPVVRSATEGSFAAWKLANGGRLRGYERYHLLAVFTTPPMHIHAPDRAGDLEELRGRTFAAPGATLRAVLQRLGLRGVWVPLDRADAAAHFNIIAGAVADMPSLVSTEATRNLTHHYMLDLGVQTMALVMQQSTYRRLTGPQRAALDQFSGAPLSLEAGRILDGLDTSLRRSMSEQGSHRFNDPSERERDAAMQLVEPYIAEWRQTHPDGEAIYQALIEALEEARAAR